jgi:hypothetical protein
MEVTKEFSQYLPEGIPLALDCYKCEVHTNDEEKLREGKLYLVQKAFNILSVKSYNFP